MQATTNTWMQYVLVVLLLATLGFAYAGNSNVKAIDMPTDVAIDYDQINSIVTAAVAGTEAGGDVDTDAIVAAVIAGIEIPKVESSYLGDFLEREFANEIGELENQSYNDVVDELEDDSEKDEDDGKYEELVEFLEDNFDDFDELKDVDNYNQDEDETEITITKLGLDEDDDKEAEVYFELKVRYEPKGDNSEKKVTVYVKSTVSYDEGKFTERDTDVEMEYSLE